ncbi:serine/threonine kinase [Mortierella sp. AD094]|nr:serine/threonine kinase [Mortierella sp. AD094]
MDGIPHEEHSLPRAFCPLGVVKGKRKSMLTMACRKRINALWEDYLSLSSHLRAHASLSGDRDNAPLSRQDYTKLMRIFCHSLKPTEAAARIVTIHHDLQTYGIKPSRKIYEMAVQANIILGSIPESARLYYEAVAARRPGSLEHKKLLRTMVDAFAVNQYTSEGIAFLDQLPRFNPEYEDPALYMHCLYKTLYVHQFREEARACNQRFFTSSAQESESSSPQYLTVIRNFVERPRLPQPEHIARALAKLEADYDINTDLHGARDSIQLFSKTVAGMIIRCGGGDAQSVAPLLQSLLLTGHLEEATRVLDMMLQHDMSPDIDQVRFNLLQSLITCTEKEDLMSVVEQWDAITSQRPISPSSEPSPTQEQPGNEWAKEYSKFIQICIQRNNLQGAVSAASYMTKRGWVAKGINFQELNSFMVNYGQSSDYTAYLDVRYALGGSLSPDLHTYRRLVYAACRRSDLTSAVTLLELAQTRHPDWTLDASIYNAIISTAAATGPMEVAEKTFACLLQDGIKPDLKSFHGLLNGYGKARDLEAAIMIPEQMIKYNLSPTTTTFNLVMKAYLGGRMDMATSRKLFRAMQLSGVEAPPDLVTFNQLLEGYRRVGNTMWFDTYFDQYFGTKPSTTDVSENDDNDDNESPLACEKKTQKKKMKKKKEKQVLIRPEKPDDWTLLIQLKHSLNLPDIDLPTVQELWRAVEPKLRPPSPSPPVTDPDSPDSSQNPLSSSSSSRPSAYTSKEANQTRPPYSRRVDPEGNLPLTHVPFKKWLGSVSMSATDRDHFRFSTLNLFRSAFQSRGDVVGVKTMDGILAELFPDHPMGWAVHYRRLVKKNRHLAKLKNQSDVQDAKSKKRIVTKEIIDTTKEMED